MQRWTMRILSKSRGRGRKTSVERTCNGSRRRCRSVFGRRQGRKRFSRGSGRRRRTRSNSMAAIVPGANAVLTCLSRRWSWRLSRFDTTTAQLEHCWRRTSPSLTKPSSPVMRSRSRPISVYRLAGAFLRRRQAAILGTSRCDVSPCDALHQGRTAKSLGTTVAHPASERPAAALPHHGAAAGGGGAALTRELTTLLLRLAIVLRPQR